MNGRQRAIQARRRTQFLEGQIGFLVDQISELVLLSGDMARLAAGAMVLRPHILDPPPLLQEFLHQAQRNPEPMSHRLPGALPSVVSSQDPFAQIQRDRLHGPSLTDPRTNDYSFI